MSATKNHHIDPPLSPASRKLKRWIRPAMPENDKPKRPLPPAYLKAPEYNPYNTKEPYNMNGSRVTSGASSFLSSNSFHHHRPSGDIVKYIPFAPTRADLRLLMVPKFYDFTCKKCNSYIVMGSDGKYGCRINRHLFSMEDGLIVEGCFADDVEDGDGLASKEKEGLEDVKVVSNLKEFREMLAEGGREEASSELLKAKIKYRI